MRLIASFTDADAGNEFSHFLTQQKIPNKCEFVESGAQLWILHEENIEAAKIWHLKYLENPDDMQFKGYGKAPIKEVQEKPKEVRIPPPYKNSPASKKQPVTTFLLIVCVLIFISRLFTAFESSPSEKTTSTKPAWTNPTYRELLYEYPSYYEHLEKLLRLYSLEELAHPEKLPEEGRILLEKLPQYKFWPGYYEILVNSQTKNIPLEARLPEFIQVKEGEIWRLFTPCLLHSDLLHIFFNMFWLLVLGPPIEKNLGKFRYLLLIILIGVFSNTLEYLMSGPNFMGFSGVIAGMVGFIWVRQKRFPWEGYRTSSSVFVILTFGIFVMAFVQLVSFYLEINGSSGFATGIANTAHISGLLAGFVLGRLSLFKATST